MVSVVVTSCGRLDLLDRTITSLLAFNNYPISQFIIVDDSGDQSVHDQLRSKYPDYDLILDPNNRGLIACIDDAYSKVNHPYIFHLEDDWEFIKEGFIDKSMKILELNPIIMQVWLRGDQNPNGHPIEPEIFYAEDIEFKLVALRQHTSWHGFTFNPGLRRLADYKLVAPYCGIHLNEHSMKNFRIQENHIGLVYFDNFGFRAASLLDVYCKHIGDGRGLNEIV
jgi:hypothetical protein